MTQSDFADKMLGRRFQGSVREALRLIFVEGKSQSDVARKLGLSRQQVNNAVRKFAGN